DRADPLEFFRKAERYRRRYVRDLSEHYRALGMHYRPAEINRLSEQWLQDQIITAQKVQSVSQEKKNRLSEEMDKLITEKRVEVKRLLDGSAKPEGRVSPVIAFSDNFEAKAMQMGEQAAFDLSTEINHAVVQGISDVYVWTSQEDARVRKTHRMLNGKKFSFN